MSTPGWQSQQAAQQASQNAQQASLNASLAASRCIAEAMYSRQRASPTRNAPASRGTPSGSDQIQTARKSESGAARRRPIRPA